MGWIESRRTGLSRMGLPEVSGTVTGVRGLCLLVDDLALPVGALVRLVPAPQSDDHYSPQRERLEHGEVIGFDGRQTIVMLFGSPNGIAPGTRVIGTGVAQTVNVGPGLLGRVVNGLGHPIDGGRTSLDVEERPLNPGPTAALRRRSITEPLPTGIRAVDAMLTLGRGQRIGIFSGPGVGKSTLLGTIARNTAADVNVIALIGERGREVRDFIERSLGPEGLARSVVFVSTGDESPLLRVRAAMAACAMAECFRDRGHDVLLMMDSISRFAQAQRQIGLSVGEQPATKGYTPSVFAMLPVLLERAGVVEGAGSVTGMYTVLVEGDDLNEPIADAVRGVLDGHIALSRSLANRGHYPAIDILESISRVADDVCDPAHIEARRHITRLISAYANAEELINIGAYAHGSNVDCDIAIALQSRIDAFLTQDPGERADYPTSCKELVDLAIDAAQRRASTPRPAPLTPQS